MTSNINPNTIDGAYPIAGVDNDSQGFRTNFTNIKNNLSYAKSEIEDIQNKAILKGALTGGSTLNNNMGGAVISSAEIQDFRETVIDLGTVSGSITLNHSASHYYTVTSSGSLTLTFSQFPPSGKLGRIRLKAIITNSAHTITLPNTVTIGSDTLEGYNTSTHVLSFAAAGTYYFEFTTDDQGTSIAVIDFTRPKKNTSTSAIWGNTSATTYERFTYANVGNNFSVAVTNRLIIDSAVIANLRGNVYLPNSPADGQTVSITSNNAVTTLAIIGNSKTVMGNVASLSANSSVKFQYVDGASKWFKVI